MKLSYTALKTFQQCRFYYRLRYDPGLVNQPWSAVQSSRVFLGTIHLFQQCLQRQQPGEKGLFPQAGASFDTLLSCFKGYDDDPTRPLTESQYQEGRASLTHYRGVHHGQFPTSYLLEEKFTLHVGSLLLASRCDWVDVTPAGYEILDYKSPHHSLPPSHPLQLDVYRLSSHVRTGEVTKKLAFYYLRSWQKESVESDDLTMAQVRVRAPGGDISRE